MIPPSVGSRETPAFFLYHQAMVLSTLPLVPNLDARSSLALVLASSILAVVTTGATLLTKLTTWFTNASTAHSALKVRRNELEILIDVFHECYNLVHGAVTVPSYVMAAFDTCTKKSEEVLETFEKFEIYFDRDYLRLQTFHRFRRVHDRFRYLLREAKADEQLASFKDSVLLLRDLCSEIKIENQLIEMSAAMSRLTELANPEVASDDLDGDSVHSGFSKASGDSQQNNQELAFHRRWGSLRHQQGELVQQTLQHVTTLSIHKYHLDVVVKVPRADASTGPFFTRYPGIVQLDTASDFNFVSLKFLQQARFDTNNLTPIPEEELQEAVGIGNATYTPHHKIRIQWSRQEERKTHDVEFYVVEEAEFDMLLGSKHCTPHLERDYVRRAALLSHPLFGRSKRRALIASEQAKEDGQQRQAQDEENAEYEARMRSNPSRHPPLGRAVTIQSNASTRFEQGPSMEAGPSNASLQPQAATPHTAGPPSAAVAAARTTSNRSRLLKWYRDGRT